MDWSTAATITAISGGLIAGMVKIFSKPGHEACENVKRLEDQMKIAEQKIEGNNTEIKVIKNDDVHTKDVLQELKRDVSKVLDLLLKDK